MGETVSVSVAVISDVSSSASTAASSATATALPDDALTQLVENRAGYQNIPPQVPVGKPIPFGPRPLPGGTTLPGATLHGTLGPASVGLPIDPPSLGGNAWITPIGTLLGAWFAAASTGEIDSHFPGDYLARKAPMYGLFNGVLDGVYIDDRGVIQPWRAWYDNFGRRVARTDYNAGNRAAGIPDVHHHIFWWGWHPETGDKVLRGWHYPGEFAPLMWPLWP